MSNTIEQLMSIDDYVALRRHVFPSVDSFKWFMRKHRTRLVESGALVRPTGRWLVNAAVCDSAVMAAAPSARAVPESRESRWG